MSVLASDIELTLANGDIIAGRLEHFPHSRTLALFDAEELHPIPLTVPVADAPEATANLAEDEVLLRNWTEHRGIPEQLADHGLVGLTDEQVQVGMFRLQAIVAKIQNSTPAPS